MLFAGNIYFIKNFNFEDGGMPSDKLLIILCIDNETSVIVRALTTSQAKVLKIKEIQVVQITIPIHFSYSKSIKVSVKSQIKQNLLLTSQLIFLLGRMSQLCN